MKKTIQLSITLTCFVLWHVSTQGATKYWDIDGATAGAGGATPAGTWDTGTTSNWTTDSSGSSAGTTWANDDDAVFSAGTDATGAFTIGVDTMQTAGNLTVEEGNITFSDFTGTINIGNFASGKGIIDVASGLTVTIDASLMGGDDTSLVTKTGTGTLVLSQANFSLGNVLVKEGVLGSANNAALPNLVTVSNNAALEIMNPSSGYGSGQPVTLNGSGPDNAGAIRKTSTANVTFAAGADLGSDARIQNNTAGNFDWTTRYISGTNGGNNFNLILGGDSTGRIRMNQVAPYNRAIDLGTGTVTKEGTCRLQIENPWICSAFYFNGGDIYPRYTGFGQGNIYVAATANSFMSLPNTSCSVIQPMELADGANIKFDVRNDNADPPNPLSFTCSGVISGLGGLTKIAPGVLFLNATNTYSGNTTIQEGTLTLGAVGSISNSPLIDVQNANSIFNVTSNASGFVLEPSQTLKGDGTVWGNVTANGTISPGASVGSLTNDGNLILGGNVLIDVDKSLSPGSSNDFITVTGSLSHSGGASLTVVNLGPALATGDSFQVFDKAVSGGGTIAVTGAGATWANNLAVDGSIAVTAVAPPAVPATNLAIQAISPTSIGLGGQGAASSAYSVYASTNVALPMSSWWKIGTTNSDAGGVIQYLDTQATNAQRFYRFGQP